MTVSRNSPPNKISHILQTKAAINGVLLLNKPYGMSSNTALQKVKKLFNAKKAGHTGTLDPLATGLLPICLGEATKFSSYLLEADKEYLATVKLGVTTSTYDAEGEIINTADVNCTQEQIISCIKTFLGKITQIPPIYSALKVNGKALYHYARNNEEVNITPREITIYELDIVNFISSSEVTLRVLCSKGTYIRSLAYDIGQKLGCGAHLSGLARTKTNKFKVGQAYTLDELIEFPPAKLKAVLLGVDVLVNHMSEVVLSDLQYAQVKNGHKFEISNSQAVPNELFRLYYDDMFLGIAALHNDNFLKPIRLCNINQFKGT